MGGSDRIRAGNLRDLRPPAKRPVSRACYRSGVNARIPEGAVPWQPAFLLCRVDGVADRFAITFDDGPSPRHTGPVLEVLARHHAHATFFQLGRRVRRRPDLSRRVRDQGHEIGLHDDLHLPPPLLPRALRERERARDVQALRDAGVAPAPFYRPPFGVMRAGHAAELRAVGITAVLGDVFPRDPERPGVDVIVRRVLGVLRPGSILILHDGSGWGDFDRMQTVQAADRILAACGERGLRAVAVGELLAAAGDQGRGRELSR